MYYHSSVWIEKVDTRLLLLLLLLYHMIMIMMIIVTTAMLSIIIFVVEVTYKFCLISRKQPQNSQGRRVYNSVTNKKYFIQNL